MRKHLLQWMLLLVAFAVPWATHAQVTLNEGFESTTWPPEDWTTIHVSGSDAWTRSTGTGAGSSSAFARRKDVNGGYNDYLITPKLTPQSGESLSFYLASQYAYSYEGTTLTIEVSTTTPEVASFTTTLATYNSGASGNFGSSGASDWVEKTVDLSAYVGQNIYIAFHATDDGFDADVCIDNVSGVSLFVPACPKPTSLSLIPSATAAAFSWEGTSTSYEYLYLEAGGTPDWADAETTTGNSADISGLIANTSYVAYVRANCGVDGVSDVVSYAFTTPCAAITVTESSPYTTGFEDGIPTCWEVLAGNPACTTSASYIHTGDAALKFTGAVGNAVALPMFADGGTTGLQLTFWTRPESTYSSCGTFAVGYMTNLDDPTTFEALESWPYSDWASSLSYVKKEVSLATVPAGARVVMKQIGNSSSFYWFIDDVEVSPLPSCLKPAGITVSNITASGAKVYWTKAQPTDNIWEVEYSTDGEIWVLANNGPVMNEYADLINLTDNTEYQVRVRTVCTVDEDYSDWTEPVTFRTECNAIVVDDENHYTVDFESGMPDCWKPLKGNITVKTTYPHNGSSYLDFRGEIGNAVALPRFANTSTLQLVFWTRPENFTNSSCGTFSVGYMTNVADATTFVPINSWAYNTFSAYDQKTVLLSDVPDGATVVMMQSNNTTGYYWYVDDVEVMPIPSCFVPTELTVVSATSEDITLTWTDPNETPAPSYTVAYGPSATFDLNDTATYETLSSDVAEATVSSLDAYTSYSFAVRADCDAFDHSDWSKTKSAMTTPSCGTYSSRMPVTGFGTTNSYSYPFYCYNSTSTSYNYGGSNLLFSADEMSALDLYEGAIHGLALRYKGDEEFTLPIQIYIKNIDATKTVFNNSSDTTDRSTMTLVYSGDVTFQPNGEWTEIPFDTTFDYTGGGVEVFMLRTAAVSGYQYFYYTTGSGNRMIYRNGSALTLTSRTVSTSRPDVRFSMCVNEPSCLMPLNLQVGEVTSTTAVLTWTNRSNAEAWHLHYGTENGTIDINPDDPNIVVVGDNITYTLTDLTPNTEYSYTLTSECGENDESEATPAISFRTLCEAITVSVDNPFTEDFSNATFPYDCWTNEHESGPGSSLWSRNTSTVHSTGGSLQIPDQSSTTVTNLTLPPMQFDPTAANGYKFSFWMYRFDNWADKLQEGVRVLINTEPTTVGATQLMYIHRHYSLGELTESASGWYQYSAIIPTSFNEGVAYIILQGINEYGGASIIDDIVIEANPSCMPLTHLAADNPTVDAVTLTWNEYDSDRPAQYLVEYTATDAETPTPVTVTVNYSAGMEVPASVNGITYTLAGLTANTAYSVRVAALCSVNDTSEWTASVPFRTACGTFDLPYTTGFETADRNSATNLPWCWTRYNSADESNPTEVASNARPGGSRSLNIPVRAAGAETQLAILPQLSASATAIPSRIVLFAKGQSALDSALTIGTMTDPTDPATFVKVTDLNLANNYTKFKVNLPLGTEYVAIRGNRPEAGTTTINLYVDDVTIEEQPGCELPEGFVKASAPTSDAIRLAWIDGEGSQWEIKYSYVPVGSDADPVEDSTIVSVANVIRGTGNTDSVYYWLSGLLSYTTYSQVKVRTVCDNENSVWADAVLSFTTQNNQNKITAFNLNGQLSSTIDAENHTVTVLMPYGTDHSMLGGNFTMSYGATADTLGGSFPTTIATATDFTEPLTLFVTAQDTNYVQQWTINVVNEACARPEAVLLDTIRKYDMYVVLDTNDFSDNTHFQVVYSTEEMDAEALAAAQPVDFTYDAEVPYHLEHLYRDTTYYVYVRANCGENSYSEWVGASATTGNLECKEDSPVVQVGTGTNTMTQAPLYTNYGGEYSIQIYTADELAEQGVSMGTITNIAYHLATIDNSTVATKYQKTASVWMMNTDKTSFTSNSDWITSGLVKVKEPEVIDFIPANSWIEVPLDEPFEWDGVSNLAVATLFVGTGSYANYSFYGSTTSDNQVIYGYADGTTLTVTDGVPTSATNTVYKYVTLNRPHIRFNFCELEQACPAPSIDTVYLTGAGTNTANVIWSLTGGEFPNTCDVYVMAHGADVESDTPVKSYLDIAAGTFEQAISGLSPYTEYDVYVRVHCDANGYNDGVSEWSAPETFLTNSNCRPVTDLTYQIVDKTHVTFSWINGSIEENEILQANNFQYAFGTTQQNINNVLIDAAGITGNPNGTASVTLDAAPETTYYFYVGNQCVDGSDSPFKLQVVEMPIACIAPTNVEASNVGKYNATITWTGDPYETNATYEIYYKYYDPVEQVIVQTPNIEDIEDTTYTLDNLQRNTEYIVYVLTRCPDYGTSFWSDSAVFTTQDMEFDCEFTGDGIVVANGTSTSSTIPLYGLNMDASNHSQSIYPESMLANLQGKAIQSMKYFVSSGGSSGSGGDWGGQQITVRLMVTDATSVSSAFVNADNATTVFSGTLANEVNTSNGMTITFDQPFVYTGGNLLVDFTSVTDYNWASCSFYGVESGSSRLQYGTSSQTPAFLPKVEFTVCGRAAVCPTMEVPTVTNITNEGATINWTASQADHVGSYEILVSDTAITNFENVEATYDNIEATATSYELPDLEPNTTYYVYVRTNCNTENYPNEGWSAWVPAAPFTTEGDCFRPSGFDYEEVTSNSVTLVWHRGNADVEAWQIDTFSTELDDYVMAAHVDLNDGELFGENNDSVRYHLVGLAPNTEYEFFVKSDCSLNDQGESDYAEESVEVRTLNNVSDFTSFVVDAIYPNGRQMAASVIDNENHTIDIEVLAGTNLAELPQYYMLPQGSNISRVEVDGEEQTLGTVVDFTQPRVYRVYAEDTNVYTDWTVTVSYEACATAHDLTATATRITATLNWLIGDDEATTFDLVFDTLPVIDLENANFATITAVADDTNRSYELPGLERGTTYYAYLRNHCAADWTNAEQVTFTTKMLTNCDADAIGNGTSTSYGPICGYFGYERNAYIFTPEDGLEEGTISALAWNYSSGSGSTIPAKIYLKNTTESAFGATSTLVWNTMIADATLVYDGTVTIASGWNEIDITDFEYTGGNLMVLVASNKTGSGGASASAYCTTSGSDNHAYMRKDGSIDDSQPFTQATAPGVNGTRHNIKFTVCESDQACPDVTDVQAELTGDGTETATLTWTAVNADYFQGYDVIVSNVEIINFDNLDPDTTVVLTSLDVENLVPYTTYYVYVRSNCTDGVHEDGNGTWVPGTFRTNSVCHTADNLTATQTDRNAFHITWTNDLNSHVQYVLSEDNLTEDELEDETPVDLEATDAFDLHNLEFETPYVLYVRHNCGENGFSPWQSTTFITGPECPWVVDAEATTYFNAAIIDWTDGQYSTATTWRLVLDTLDANEEPVTVFDSVVNSHPFTVIGLAAETDYDVEIYAICGDEESEVYNDLHFTTPAAPGDCQIVAQGTSTTTYVPVYGTYMDDPHGTQSIYPASMLTDLVGQEIVSLHYLVSSMGTYDMGSNKSLKVWMTEVSAADLSAGYQSIANATLVYDGTVSQSDFSVANGYTVTLDEPYVYNGGNLLIAFQANVEDVSGWNSVTFQALDATNASRYGSNTSNYNFTATGNPHDVLPTVEFCVAPSDCHAVRNLANANVTSNSADVNWLPGGSETQWNMVVSTTELNAEALAEAQAQVVTSVNQTLPDLTVDADYYVYVRPICDANEDLYGDWKMIHFITLPTCSAPATAVAEVQENGDVTFTVTAGENGEPASYTYAYWMGDDTANAIVGTSEEATWTLSNLPETQTINWKVRANCGAEDNSRWTAGNSFYICGTFVVTETNPFVENLETFDNLTCWTSVDDGNNHQWSVVYGAGNKIWFYSGYYGDIYLATPPIQLPAEGRVSFTFNDSVIYASDYGGSRVFLLKEDATQIELWNDDVTVANGFRSHNIDMSDYLGETFYLVFKYEGNNAHGWYVNNIHVEMVPAYHVTANVATTDDERGQVTLAGDTTDDGRYYQNTGATLTATAETGYTFVNWTDTNNQVVSTDTVWTLLPTCDTVLIANFDTNSHTLKATVSSMEASRGYVTLDGVQPTSGNTAVSAVVKYMTTHTLAAVANDHYEFDHWADITDTGDPNYAANPRTVTMPDRDTTIRATFHAVATQVVDTQTACDKYELRNSNEDLVETYYTGGVKTKSYDDPQLGSIELTLTLTLNHSSSTGFRPEAQCDSYTWVRTDATTEDIDHSVNAYTYEYTSVEGCPSVDTLWLTVNASTEETLQEPVEACDSYEFLGTTFTESNANATVVTTNAAGCDSTIHFALTINASTSHQLLQEACDEFTWNRADQTSVTYTYENDGANVNDVHVSTNAAGCDSTETLVLTLASSTSSGGQQTMTVCDSTQWHSIWRTTTGDYYFTINVGECQGIDTLHLTVNQSTHTSTTADECDTYTWNRIDGEEVVYTASAEEVFSYTNDAQCASADTLHLTIHHSSSTLTDTAACGSYTWTRGDATTATYTESVVQTLYNYTSTEGCASTDTLRLVIEQGRTSKNVDTACGSYFWEYKNQTYTQSGTYYNNSQTTGGCPIRDTLVLTVKANAYFTDVMDDVCDSVLWNGTMYNASTNTATYTVENGAANGCDSIVTLNLTVKHATHTAISPVVCDTYIWEDGNGQTYTASTEAVHTYTNAEGCASADTLHLTVATATFGDTAATECDNFTWYGQNYTESAEPTHVLTNAAGCDSTVTLHLTINYTANSEDTATACESYGWNNQTYTTSGDKTYMVTAGAANGCDSIVTLHLTINHATTGVAEVAACETYTWETGDGQTYTASTNTPTYTMVNGAANGCDSIVTLHLTINHANTGEESVTACGSYTWHGTNYTVDGDYNDTVVNGNVYGCDSVVTLHLTFASTLTETVTVSACESYEWHGVTYTASTNTPTYQTQTLNGCDSIATLHLTINTATTGDTTAVACDSFTWHGTAYTESTNTPTFTMVAGNANGCDSTVTLHLTINTATTGDTTAVACDSFTWHGTAYTESTETPTYTMVAGNANGCDSVVTLHLTINTAATGEESVTACGSYTWHEQTYTASGDQVYTMENGAANGCDSVITLHLTILSGYTADSTARACDSFTWYGTTYTESAEPTHTLTAIDGCDSVVTLHLTINYSTETDVTEEVTADQLPYIFAGQSFDEFGQYDIVIANAAGCDSTIHLTLNERQGIEDAGVLSLLKVYPNPTTGRVQLSAEQIDKVEVLDLVGRRVALFENTNTFDLSNLAAGTYTLRITMPEGTTLRKVVKR